MAFNDPGCRGEHQRGAARRIEMACRESDGQTVTLTWEDAVTALLNLETMHYSENDMNIMRALIGIHKKQGEEK